MTVKTPLYEEHVALSGKIVDFAGFFLPVQSPTGVIAEHMAVREKAGLFDVSHMGEVTFKGKDALANINRIFTNDYTNLKIGKVRYGVSLGVMALISEIPFDLEHQNKLFDLHGQNIFFTLLLGYLAICAVEQWKSKHPILLIPVLIGIMLAAGFGLVDYGVFGVAFIVVLYALRQNEFFRLFSAFLLGNSRFVMLAFLPMSLYNGKRGFIKGKFLKYAFYAIYPVHIFIIYLLKLHWGLFQ